MSDGIPDVFTRARKNFANNSMIADKEIQIENKQDSDASRISQTHLHKKTKRNRISTA